MSYKPYGAHFRHQEFWGTLHGLDYVPDGTPCKIVGVDGGLIVKFVNPTTKLDDLWLVSFDAVRMAYPPTLPDQG